MITDTALQDAVRALLGRAWNVQPGASGYRAQLPCGNPTSMAREDLERVQAEGWHVTAKADGERAVLVCLQHRGRNTAVMVDRGYAMRSVSLVCKAGYFLGTVLDGELVLLKEPEAVAGADATPAAVGLARFAWLAFDALMVRYNCYTDQGYSARLALLKIAAPTSAEDTAAKGFLGVDPKRHASLELRLKHVAPLSEACALLTQLLSGVLEYEADGLVFTAPHGKPHAGRDAHCLKWRGVTSPGVDVYMRQEVTEGELRTWLTCPGDRAPKVELLWVLRSQGLQNVHVDAATLVRAYEEGGCVPDGVSEFLVDRVANPTDPEAPGRLMLRWSRPRPDKARANDLGVIARTLREAERPIKLMDIFALH